MIFGTTYTFLLILKRIIPSLIGVLRGPAFGISDVEIYEISHVGKDSFWGKHC